MAWIDLLDAIKRRFYRAPATIRADFLTDVANTLDLKGDEAALKKRTYEEAETEWKIH